MTLEILDTLQATQMVHLATCENGQPRLRPMTLICKGRRLYFATGATDHKSAQIAANPRAEFCLLYRDGANTGYLRGSGTLAQVDEVPRKKEIADFATFIYDYWQDAADPGYRLYELQLDQLRYMKPGDMLESVLDI